MSCPNILKRIVVIAITIIILRIIMKIIMKMIMSIVTNDYDRKITRKEK
jgi:hypothetical protein